ncbi:MAG: tetratricopeptide repeat protein [Terriglobia bacterium]
MRILANRIVISLLLILAGMGCWEFALPRVSRILYSAAASDYQQHHYDRSRAELRVALEFEPNDPSFLTLIGWDALKVHQAAAASAYFRQAHHFAPGNSGALLGEIYAEIALQNYGAAERLLNELHRRYGDTAAFKSAGEVLAANSAPSNPAADQAVAAGPSGAVAPLNKMDLMGMQPGPMRRR